MVELSKRLEEIRQNTLEPINTQVANSDNPSDGLLKLQKEIGFLYDQVFSTYSKLKTIQEDAQEMEKLFLEKKMRSVDFETAKRIKNLFKSIKDV